MDPNEAYRRRLCDEDLKPEPTSERSFGLFKPDLSMSYDVGLSKRSQATAPTPATASPFLLVHTPVTPQIQTPSPVNSATQVSPARGRSSTTSGVSVPNSGATDNLLQKNPAAVLLALVVMLLVQ